MPRVDFFVLPASVSPEYFACLRAGEARREGLAIHIHVQSPEDAADLDDLLWTFRDVSFVPHALVEAGEARAEAVTIGWDAPAPESDVLINLAREVPPFAQSFGRIVEPVADHAELKQQARARFRRYRELGFEPSSQDIGEQNGRD